MAEVKSRIQKRAAGATKLTKAEIKGKLLEFAWHLKKEARSDATIKTYNSLLRKLVRLGANLNPQ